MGRPTKAQSVLIAQRRAKAVEMRIAGASFQQIADELGYNSRGAACQDVTRALEAAIAEQTRASEVYREEELQRLDMLLAEAWRVMKRHHAVVSNGKVVKVDTKDGAEETLLDDGPVLAAIDRVLKIQERRAKLLGLDAPTKVEAITIDALDAEIARLAAELEGDQAREAAGAAPAEG